MSKGMTAHILLSTFFTPIISATIFDDKFIICK